MIIRAGMDPARPQAQTDEDKERVQQPGNEPLPVRSRKKGKQEPCQKTGDERSQEEKRIAEENRRGGRMPSTGRDALPAARPPKPEGRGQDEKRARHGRGGEDKGSHAQGARAADHLLRAADPEPHRRDHGGEDAQARCGERGGGGEPPDSRHPGEQQSEGYRSEDGEDRECRAHREARESVAGAVTSRAAAGWRAGPAARSAAPSR